MIKKRNVALRETAGRRARVRSKEITSRKINHLFVLHKIQWSFAPSSINLIIHAGNKKLSSFSYQSSLPTSMLKVVGGTMSNGQAETIHFVDAAKPAYWPVYHWIWSKFVCSRNPEIALRLEVHSKRFTAKQTCPYLLVFIQLSQRVSFEGNNCFAVTSPDCFSL